MAATASTPITPPKSPVFYPQLSGWLGAVNKSAATQSETNQPAINIVPPSSGASSPPAAITPLNQVLSNANAQQENSLLSGISSPEAVAREALDLATNALPENTEPPKGKAKFKSRLRRALLPRFVLNMLLGKTLADLIYPWIHPKARSGVSTM